MVGVGEEPQFEDGVTALPLSLTGRADHAANDGSISAASRVMFASGTKRACRDYLLFVRFWGKADVGCEPAVIVLAAFDPKRTSAASPDALPWLSDIARQAAMCCARPTITRPRRSMSAALELRSQA